MNYDLEITSAYEVAGRDFSWDSEWGWEGLGIGEYILRSPDVDAIRIKLQERKWIVPRLPLVDFVRTTHSIMKTKDGTVLGVVPIKLLDKLNTRKVPVVDETLFS